MFWVMRTRYIWLGRNFVGFMLMFMLLEKGFCTAHKVRQKYSTICANNRFFCRVQIEENLEKKELREQFFYLCKKPRDAQTIITLTVKLKTSRLINPLHSLSRPVVSKNVDGKWTPLLPVHIKSAHYDVARIVHTSIYVFIFV